MNANHNRMRPEIGNTNVGRDFYTNGVDAMRTGSKTGENFYVFFIDCSVVYSTTQSLFY